MDNGKRFAFVCLLCYYLFVCLLALFLSVFCFVLLFAFLPILGLTFIPKKATLAKMSRTWRRARSPGYRVWGVRSLSGKLRQGKDKKKAGSRHHTQ